MKTWGGTCPGAPLVPTPKSLFRCMHWCNTSYYYVIYKPGYLKGVDVIAETTVLVTNKAQTFYWAGYGLKLCIPEGALSVNMEECRIFIKVGLSGQFELPKNTSTVSTIYWLDSVPQCKFPSPSLWKYSTVQNPHKRQC